MREMETFGVTLNITSHYLLTNNFTETPRMGKINKNICCSFKELDTLLEVSTYAISFSLIITDKHKVKSTLSKQTIAPFI